MNDNYTPQDEYDPSWDEPTQEIPQAAIDFQLMLDDRVRNLTSNLEIRHNYKAIDVVTMLFPHFKKRLNS